MSGGYRGSNGKGTTQGTGLPAVVGRQAREARDRRGTRGSRRYTTTDTGTAVIAAGGTAKFTIVWPTPFPDAGYMAVAQVTAPAGHPYGMTAIVDQTAEGLSVAYTAVKDTPAGTTVMVRAIHP